MITRESVMQALFDLTAPLEPTILKRRSRTAITWDDAAQSDQPALFQMYGQETSQTVKGLPTIHTLTVQWFVYCNGTNDPDEVRSTILNPVLDALTQALFPTPGMDTQTLGGKVVRVSPGSWEPYEGVLGSQIIAVLDIQIVYVPELAGAGCL